MLPIMGESSVKVKTHLYIGMLVCLAIIIVTLKLANAQDINSLIPDTSISTESIPQISDDGIVQYILETPSMDIAIQPEPKPITFPLSSEQLSKLEQAWIQRAIREGKEPLFYVKLAEQEKSQKELVKKIARDQATCGTGFEIYPDSGICSKFGGHVEAEQNYYHCSLNNYQLALRNGELEAKCGYGAPSASVCMDVGAVKDGGGLWKPTADPKARCSGGTTILLDKKYDGVDAMQILDSNKQFIMDASYYGKLADGRPRFCAEGRPGSSFGSGPIYTKYNSNGVSECRSVSNPSNRED
jgi:hypothetical protein